MTNLKFTFISDIDAPRIRQLFAMWKDRILPTIGIDARLFEESWDGTTSQTLAVQAQAVGLAGEPVAIPSTSARNPSDVDEPDTTTSTTTPPSRREHRGYSPKFHVEPPPYPT